MVTNFDVIIKSNPNDLINVLGSASLAVNKSTGKIVRCRDTRCDNCIFSVHGCSDENKMEWLKSPAENQDDVIDSKNSQGEITW